MTENGNELALFNAEADVRQCRGDVITRFGFLGIVIKHCYVFKFN